MKLDRNLQISLLVARYTFLYAGLRTAFGIALTAAVSATLWYQSNIRCIEAWVAAHWADMIPGVMSYALSGRPVFLLAGGSRAVGLVVSAECTVSLLMIPLLVWSLLLVAARRVNIAKLFAGLIVSLLLLTAVNQLRLITIGWAYFSMGRTGYEWSHTVVGSIISILGMILAVMVYIRIALVNQSAQPFKVAS